MTMGSAEYDGTQREQEQILREEIQRRGLAAGGPALNLLFAVWNTRPLIDAAGNQYAEEITLAAVAGNDTAGNTGQMTLRITDPALWGRITVGQDYPLTFPLAQPQSEAA